MHSTCLTPLLSIWALLPLTFGSLLNMRQAIPDDGPCGGNQTIYSITSQIPILYGPLIRPAGNVCNSSDQNCTPSTNVVDYANVTIPIGPSDLNLTAISLQNITSPKPISTSGLPVAYNLNQVQAPDNFAVNVIILTRYWNVSGSYQCIPGDDSSMPFEVHFPVSDDIGLQEVNFSLPGTAPGDTIEIDDAIIQFCSAVDNAGNAQNIPSCSIVSQTTAMERREASW